MCFASAEPRWRATSHWSRAAWPDALGSWLVDQASLTRRLKACCGGDFRVTILRQGWGLPTPSERRALALAPRLRAWIREVYLWCGASRWVYARTLIPCTSLTGGLQRLVRLGTRPLGEVIFADRSMRRGPIEVARIHPGARVLAPVRSSVKSAVWGRRGVFWLQERPLLVCEFFLPEMVVALE